VRALADRCVCIPNGPQLSLSPATSYRMRCAHETPAVWSRQPRVEAYSSPRAMIFAHANTREMASRDLRRASALLRSEEKDMPSGQGSHKIRNRIIIIGESRGILKFFLLNDQRSICSVNRISKCLFIRESIKA